MKQLKFLCTGMLALLISLNSCKKEELTITNSANEELNNNTAVLDEIILGKQLENPYSLENMTKAFKAANPSKLKSMKSLEATHLYVRFAPKSVEEKELLNQDTTLSLYEYPLDYEILQYGQYYHDPTIPENQITYQYTVVEVGYQFPNIEYEILSELYLPSEEDEEVELKSLQITNNLAIDTTQTKNLELGKDKYRPEGNIFVQDDILNRDVPLRNVKVRIRNWFKIDNISTDVNGHFRSIEYKGDVDIIVLFENSHCNLRSTLINIIGTADTKLANEVKSLNIVISRDGRNTTTTPLPNGYRNFSDDKVWAWATVFNAVEDYWTYCSTQIIGTPRSGLKIWVNKNSRSGAAGDEMTGAAPMFHRGWDFYKLNGDNFWKWIANVLYIPVSNVLMNVFHAFLPDIVITYGANNVNSADINEVTFHELSHASHENKVGESYWYKYVNYTVTNNGYGNGTGHNFGVCALGEMWGYHMGWFLSRDKYGANAPVSLNIEENFTPLARGGNPGMRIIDVAGNRASWIPAGLLQDLTDTNSDQIQGTFWDNADGYTNDQIFNALDWGVESPQQFRDRLLRENLNRDQVDVNSLFEGYFFN